MRKISSASTHKATARSRFSLAYRSFVPVRSLASDVKNSASTLKIRTVQIRQAFAAALWVVVDGRKNNAFRGYLIVIIVGNEG